MLLHCWGTRECILISFWPVCSRVKLIFIVKTANWPPLYVISGGLSLIFVSICYVIFVLFCILWLLLFFSFFFSFSDILVFSLNWFFTLIAFDKKGNSVPMQDFWRDIFWPGCENKLHPIHLKASVNKAIFFFIICDHLCFWTVHGLFGQDARWCAFVVHTL